MASGKNKINYQVGFNINKNNLNEIKSTLQKLSDMSAKDLIKINNSDLKTAQQNLNSIREQAENVKKALESAYNAKLNTVNVESFNRSLKESNSSIDKVYKSFKAAGATGENAFRNLSSQLFNTNIQLRESHAILDKVASTLMNSARWTIASSVVNGFSRSIQQAYGYVKSLDSSLNNIRIVTGKSAEDMAAFAEQANKAAKELGTTTTDYTNAALIYAQQGLSDQEIARRSEITLKTANVTGQSTEAVSEELTAVWNGYKVNAEEAEIYVDRLAAVAATTASNLQELSTGMSKVASAANAMGVGEDKLAAQLSTIISATRQAPESVGTALRTVYARISDIQAGIDEDGVTLGNYSGKMADLGFNVLDTTGHLRDMGDVMEQIGNKWEDLTREQQVYLAQTMAGQRQYNNLLALFDNFEKYNEALLTAQEAEGVLQEQQDTRMESTTAHLKVLKASLEDMQDSLLDADSINTVADLLASTANLAASFIDSIGGGKAVLASLGTIAMTVFSEQIAKGINTTVMNFETAENNARIFEQQLSEIKKWEGIPQLDETTKKLLGLKEQLIETAKLMTPEQFQFYKEAIENVKNIGNDIAIDAQAVKPIENFIEKMTGLKDIHLEEVYGTKKWGQITDQIYKHGNAFTELGQKTEKALEDIKKFYNEEQSLFQDNQDNGLITGIINEQSFNYAKGLLEQSKNELDHFITEVNGKDIEFSDEFQQEVEEIKREISSLQFSDSFDLNTFQQLFNRIRDVAEQGAQEVNTSIDKVFKEEQIRKFAERLRQMEETAERGAQGINNSLLRLRKAFQIQNFVTWIGAFGQITNSIRQIQHLGSVWKNEDISLNEKFLQSITNISFSLPMLINGFTKLNNTFGFLGKAVVETAQRMEVMEDTVRGGIGPITLLTAKTGQSAVVIDVFGKTLAFSPIGLWVAGITAAITALGFFINQANEANKAAIEFHKTNIEEANKKQQQINKNKQLYTSLEELNQKYKQGEITRAELKSSVEDLVSQYDLEESSVKKLTEGYDNLARAIKEERQQAASQGLENAEVKKTQASELIKDTAEGSVWDAGRKSGKRYILDLGLGRNVQKATREEFLNAGMYLDENEIGTFATNFDTKSILEMYDKISEAIENIRKREDFEQADFENDTFYKQATEWLEKMDQSIQSYRQANQSIASFSTQVKGLESNSFDNIQTATQYIQKRQEFIDTIKKQFETQGIDSDPQKAADEYLKQYFKDLYLQFDDFSDAVKRFRQEFGKQNSIVESALGKLDPDQLRTLMDLFEVQPTAIKSWEDLGNAINYVSKQDLSNINFGGDIDAMQAAASERYTMYQSLQDQVSSGKNISKKELESLNPEFQKFFSMMANGSFKMTGDAKEFYDTVNSFKLEGFYDTLNQIENKINFINQYSEKRFDTDRLQGMGRSSTDTLIKDQLDFLEIVSAGNAQMETAVELWREQYKTARMTQESAAAIQQAVKNAVSQTKNLVGQSDGLKEKAKEIAHELHDALFPTDSDVDASALQSLTEVLEKISTASEELDDNLNKDARAAEDVAESILRFDDAIQNVVDNYEAWSGALTSGSVQEQAEAISGLRDAYADLLDLDGSSLSESFLTNVQNLELMKAAIDGNTQAYDKLMDLAGQDIATQIHLDTDVFQEDFNNLMDLYYQGQSLDDLEIGASLDNEKFLDELSNMVTAASMTAQQATDYLASMGVDAQIIQQKTTAQDNVQYTGAKATVKTQEVESVNPSNGQPVTYRIPSIYYETVPADGVETKQSTAFALKVVSAHKTSGGGFKYKQSANGAGAKGQARRKAEAEKAAKAQKAANKTQKDNTNTSTKDFKKPVQAQKDLYHDINIEIKKINRDLERTQKIQERLYGKPLLDNLNKQTAILQAQKERLKEKQQLQKQDLANQQQILKSLGVTFDQYGNINDYMSILQAKQDAINRLVDEQNSLVGAYNSSIDKTYKEGLGNEISAYDKAIQSAQEDLKNTQAKIKDYDSLRDSMEDLVDQIDEITQKQVEINIKKFRMQLEIRLQMGEAERDWNEFVRKVINKTDVMKDTDFDQIFKDAGKNVMDLNSFFNINGSIGVVQKLTQQLLDTRKQIEDIDRTGTSAIYGDNKAKAMEDLKSDLSELMKQMQSIEDLIADIDKAYLDTIDDIADQFDKQQDDYDFINDLIQHDMDLLSMLYGDKNYDAMENYYKELERNQNNQIDSLRKQIDFWKKEWQQALLAGDTNAAKQFEQNYKKAIEEINSLIEQAAKTVSEKYTNAIDKIFDELDKKISNGKGTDYLSEEWDLMNKNADEYLDTINAAFAIQELQGKFQDALNKPNSLKNQQALKDVMNQQLEILNNKQKITQYDVDRAQKMLQIEQARIALEDIRASKTTLRLKRDSQGNYSYQYVADQNGIYDAEQNLAAAQNDLYNFDKQRYQSNLQEMLAAWKDFQSKYKDIVADTSLTEEERIRQLSLLREEYADFINNKTQQNLDVRKNLTESAFNDIAAIYDMDIVNYQKMTDDEKNIIMGDLVPAWKSGIQQMTDKVAGQGGFIPTCQDAFEQISDTTLEYEKELDSLANTAGVDLNNIQVGVDDLIYEFEGLVEENDDLLDRMSDELYAIQDLRDAAQALVYDYDSVYVAAANAVSQLHDFVQSEREAAASAQSTAQTYEQSRILMEQAEWNYARGAADALGALSDAAEQNAGRMQDAADRYEDALNRMLNLNNSANETTYNPNGSGNHYMYGRGATHGVYDYSSNRVGDLTPYIDRHYRFKDSQVAFFDTGGYTGEWGSTDGRLAVLHKKELVLDEKDTKNILNSVSILRSITKNVGSSLADKISNLSINRMTSGLTSTLNESIDQNVHISATFPNVNSKKQIEDAFTDLVNLAAQRAMKRR